MKHEERTGMSKVADGSTVDPSDFLRLASLILRHFGHDTENGAWRLVHWRGEFYSANSDEGWKKSDGLQVRALVRDWLSQCSFRSKNFDAAGDTILKRVKPTRRMVLEVLEAMIDLVHLSPTIEPPFWLGESVQKIPRASEYTLVANGLLHLPTKRLMPHDSRYFCLNRLSVPYLPNAPKPILWLKFLNEIFCNDKKSIDCLHEIIGYLVTNETHLQKLFLIVGPPRSGKGTINKIVMKLVGSDNICHPSLSGIAKNFGRSVMIGKKVAWFSDARFSNARRADAEIACESLLSISGEDSVTIDRKNKDLWHGRLGVRIVICSNELPRFDESSGAFASRIVALKMLRTFARKVDPFLVEKLSAEISGILNLALDGLDRLNQRGEFTSSRTGEILVREMGELSSPISMFVDEHCELGSGASVKKQSLYNLWCQWCAQNGIPPNSKSSFGQKLMACCPSLESTRPVSPEGTRYYEYRGIAIRDDSSRPSTTDPDYGPKESFV